MFCHSAEGQICSSGQLPAESRATGTVNTTDKSFYDTKLKNSALAQILVWLLWLSVKADVYICVCQARLVSLVNYTQECIIFTWQSDEYKLGRINTCFCSSSNYSQWLLKLSKELLLWKRHLENFFDKFFFQQGQGIGEMDQYFTDSDGHVCKWLQKHEKPLGNGVWVNTQVLKLQAAWIQ